MLRGTSYLSSITYLIIYTKYQQIKTSLSDIKLQHHSPLTLRSLLLRLYDSMVQGWPPIRCYWLFTKLIIAYSLGRKIDYLSLIECAWSYTRWCLWRLQVPDDVPNIISIDWKRGNPVFSCIPPRKRPWESWREVNVVDFMPTFDE